MTIQSEKVKEAQERLKKMADRKEENKALTKDKKEPIVYDNNYLVQVVCAILAADKTRLLDIPSAVNKAKQVLNAIG